MAELPPNAAQLLPAPDDTWHAEREKAQLAATLARKFMTEGNEAYLGGMLSVMASIASTSTVSARTRARTAAAYIKLAIEASTRGFRGVAVQVNNGVPVQPTGQVRDRAFWQAILADAPARAQLLDQLSTELGVAAPVKATRPGKAEAPPVADVVPSKPAKRRTSRNGHAAGNGAAT